MYSMMEQALGEVISPGHTPTRTRAEMCDLFETKSVADIIVQTVV